MSTDDIKILLRCLFYFYFLLLIMKDRGKLNEIFFLFSCFMKAFVSDFGGKS